MGHIGWIEVDYMHEGLYNLLTVNVPLITGHMEMDKQLSP